MSQILLIEDERLLRENTKELLEAHGYDCITASDGREGLKVAVQKIPDVIICDILLPLMNGFDIKKELNNLSSTASIPFIFLSAKIEREDLRKGMDLGADDYITKPFKIKELINSIEGRLTQKQAVKEMINTVIATTLFDFIHVSKHECNTPLHAIITLSDLMIYPEYNDPKFIFEASTAINKSGRRLFKTLNNLIELVRLRHYDLEKPEEIECINISQLLKEIISKLSSSEDRKEDLNVYIENIRTNIIARQDLQVLLSEIIGNALKFSASGSEINVHLASEGGKKGKLVLMISNVMSTPVSCTIDDVGPFTQFNRSRTEQQGSGLGLYLAYLVIKKYGGGLSIETADGQTFNVTASMPVR